MISKLRHALYWSSLAFLSALFAWILVRAGHAWAVAVVVGVAVVRMLAPRLPRSLDRARGVPAALRRAPALRGVLLAPFGPVVIAGIALAARLGWALHFQVQPISDFEKFFEDAAALAQGHWAVLGATKSPLTVLFYGALFRPLGASMHIVYGANAVLGATCAVLVYGIARRAFPSPAPARLAGLAVAVFPSLAMHAPLPSSEAVFAVLLLAMVRSAMRLIDPAHAAGRGGTMRAGALLGVGTAVLHLTRNTGIVIGAWIFVVALLWVRASWRTRAASFALYAACLAALLAPQVVYNYRTYGYFSIQSSKYGALNLLLGTTSAGAQTSPRARSEILRKYPFNDETWPEVSKQIRRDAWAPVREHPAAFLHFALTTKFDAMWCSDRYAADTLRWKKQGDRRALADAVDRWGRRADGFYIAAVLAAALGLCMGRYRDTGYGALVAIAGGVLGFVFLLHVFIEVQPRYHVAIVYFLAVLAGALFDVREPGAERTGIPPASVADVS